ncbi:unnamed protein product [Schistosoma mattheei]|uniref:Uncharacterized protein n=1 Tax=Schistosoma mattheei TaxID=31246 RepID=A0A3P8I1W3_9TREM|nr:unnamed protein product [Schistosoma mattheei]
MSFIPNLAEENVQYLCSYRHVCFQHLCWNVVWSCCFATLNLSYGHADFFNCWWANIDCEVRECYFDVDRVQWCWSIQEFFEVFYSSVSVLFNIGDYLAFLVFHWSFWFTIIFNEFLYCVIQLSHISFTCSLFHRYC